MRRLLIALLLLTVPSIVHAQTTRTLHYQYLNTTPATVGTYQQAVLLDNVLLAGTPTCVASGPNTNCTFPLGVIASGTHTIKVVASLGGNSVEGILANYNPANDPTLPSGLKVIVTVTIVVP